MTTVNYDRDVKPFDDAGGWTDENIARELNGQTFNAIALGPSRGYHSDASWWANTSDGTYEGEFEDIRNDAGTPAGIKQVLKNIWTMLFGVSQSSMNTTLRLNPSGRVMPNQFAGDLHEFLLWAVTNAVNVTQAQVDEFYVIGAGLKYAGEIVTAADVTVSRTSGTESERLNATYQSQYDAIMAPILTSTDPAVLTDANCIAALNQMADTWPT